MPIYTSGGQTVRLKNEMTDQDFNSVNCEWLYSSFDSPYIYDDGPKKALADFLNNKTRGPYYVHTTDNQGHGASGQILAVVLIHPDDRKAFAAQFTTEHWKENLRAAESNAKVLTFQSEKGFKYENPYMAALLDEVTEDRERTQVVLRGTDLDDMAKKLWPTHAKPLPAPPARLR